MPKLIDIAFTNPTRTLNKAIPSIYVGMEHLEPRQRFIQKCGVRRFPGSGSRFKNDDTLLARITPCFENGKAAFVDCLKDGEVGWGSTEFIILRAKIGIPNFAPYCIVRDPLFKEYGVRQMTGTSGRQRISATSLSEYMTPIPSNHDLEYFDKKSNELNSLIARLGKENVILAKLRDRLIYKAISASTQLDSVCSEQVDSFLNIDTSNMQTSGALFK